MSTVADYVLIKDSSFAFGPPLVTHRFKFTVPANTNLGSRSILSFNVGGIKGDDDTLKLRVSINGEQVYSYNSTADVKGFSTVQEIVGANLLKHGTDANDVTFARESGFGEATLSDVVLLVQVDSLQTPTVQIDGRGNIFAGGNGSDGDLVLRDGRGRDRVRLDADGANLYMGGSGADGDIVLYPSHMGIDSSPEIASIHLDAGNSRITVGGGGNLDASRDGEIYLDSGTSHRIVMDSAGAGIKVGGNGADGDITLYAAGGGQSESNATIHLDGDGRDVHLGGNGKGGRLLMYKSTGDNQTVADSTVLLGAESANLLLGGPGTSGDVYVFPSSAPGKAEGDTSIRLKGDTGDIIFTGQLIGPGADCAEDFEIEDAESVEPGTVMVIGADSRLHVAQRPYDSCVAGVIAGAGDVRPGIILGRGQGRDPRRLPVALMGRVFCKAVADDAPIAVGDLLTTSASPGHAMKAGDSARAFGAVIGKALAPLPAGRGLIPVLVALQ